MSEPGTLMHFVVVFLVIGSLVAISGVFVAAEIALVGVRPTHLRGLAKDGSRPAARLLDVLSSPTSQSRYFATTQLGITTASIGLGMYGERQLAAMLEPTLVQLGLPGSAAHAVAVPVSVALLTYLHVVVGDLLFKTMALRYPTAAVTRVSPIMTAAQMFLRPFVALIAALSALVLRLTSFPPAKAGERIISGRELGRIIEATAESGLIADRDERILQDVIAFGEREVHHVMTPRTRVEAVPIDIAEENLAPRLADARHTRFPVYEGNLDHVVGVLHMKDYLRARFDPAQPFDLRLILRKAHLVPEHMPLSQLLERFRKAREHLAIVIDEYGGTAGVVTLEDVIEELVGEVHDEFDVGEVPPIRVLRPDVLIARGDVQLADIAEHINLPTERPQVDTVGGLVFNLLGGPATVGDEVRLGNIKLMVMKVDGLTVELVRLEVDAETSAEDHGN